jgi:hypothetical protein
VGGGALKRGENPWGETRDGRGEAARWGTALTVTERLVQQMEPNCRLRCIRVCVCVCVCVCVRVCVWLCTHTVVYLV